MTTQSDQRTEIGLTQEQAARRAGVSVATWRRWERNPASVTEEVAAQCQEALDAAEDGQWDDMTAMLQILYPAVELSPMGRQLQLIDAYASLAKISYEVFAAGAKQPAVMVRKRFGQAVIRVRLCEALADESGETDALASVTALLVDAGIPLPTGNGQ